jgi:hypothetical protein
LFGLVFLYIKQIIYIKKIKKIQLYMQKMIWTLVSPRVPKVKHLTMHLPY